MWCHWHWHHMIPLALSMAHGTDACTGTSTSTKGHILTLNNHLNIIKAMVSMMAPSTSSYYHAHEKLMCPSNATFMLHMPISSCPHDTSMSVHMPPMNPLLSTIWTGTLVYIHFTILYWNREQTWRRYRGEHQWTALKTERKRYIAMIRKAKTHTLSSQIIDAGKDTKTLFSLIDTMTGSNKSNPLPSPLVMRNWPKNLPLFSWTKLEKIRDAIDAHPKFKPSRHNTSNSFDNFTMLVKDEVEKIIMSMPTKSCKLDVLPTKVLKEIIKPLLPLLTKIINLLLTEELFVKEWKVAIIHPLLKKLGLDLISKNYRPVSNLPFLSKVVEKCTLKQFIKHCDDNSLLPTYQSAYRKNYSGKTALVKLFDDLVWLMERQKVNLLEAIDLSATFDMVNHDILIDVLNTACNVGGKSLDWFKSYLYPGSCKVNISESFSRNQDLCLSVPHGSLCGQVLYNVYVTQWICMHICMLHMDAYQTYGVCNYCI